MPRDTRLTIRVPRDLWLPAAVCSYGYFLLAPNRWRPDRMTLQRSMNAAEFGLPPAVFDVQIAQPTGRGTPLRVRCDRPVSRRVARGVREAVARMLRLDKDLRRWRKLCPAASRRGFGRLFRSPTLFEDMVKTITSCNVGWPSTVRMNELLVEEVGRGAFPTPDQLAGYSPDRLKKSCRVGYRAGRIVNLARRFADGSITPARFDDLPTRADTVRERLLELDGFGPYAAANVMQCVGFDDELPIDTESYRLYCKKTGVARPDDPRRLDPAIHDRYEPYRPHRFLAYWFELWRDYESQRGDAWTWNPDQVGASFTASRLD